MPFFHLVFCCLTIFNVSEGRIVQGIIGRNVSFLLTLNNIGMDAVNILHDWSPFLWIWPANNFIDLRVQTDRVKVSVNKTENDIVIVTVIILNIRKTDGGIYRVIREWNSEEFNDSVLLQTIDEKMIPKIAIVQDDILHSTLVLECKISNVSTRKSFWSLNETLIENNDRYSQNDTFITIRNLTVNDQYNVYKCKESRSGYESEPYTIQVSFNLYTTMTTSPLKDTLVLPPQPNLMFIVLGIGSIVATAFVSCLLYKIRMCLHVDIASSANTSTYSNSHGADENVHDVNLCGNYWTIVSNTQGELSTAIDNEFARHRIPLLKGQSIFHTNNESEVLMKLNDVEDNEDRNGFQNPIHSHPVELDDYLHAVHSDPDNTDSMSTYREPLINEQNTSHPNKELEFYAKRDGVDVNDNNDGYLNPIHDTHIDFNAYIHPVHSDLENTSIASTYMDPPQSDQCVFHPNELKQSGKLYDIEVNEELDGHLNPIHAPGVDFDAYIHPVHYDPENTEYLSRHREAPLILHTTCHITNESDQSAKIDGVEVRVELDGCMHPIDAAPVDCDYFIHPVHSDPKN